MKVVITSPVLHGADFLESGQEADIDDVSAKQLIESGVAIALLKKKTADTGDK